jgi:hypothetical protein
MAFQNCLPNIAAMIQIMAAGSDIDRPKSY